MHFGIAFPTINFASAILKIKVPFIGIKGSMKNLEHPWNLQTKKRFFTVKEGSLDFLNGLQKWFF